MNWAALLNLQGLAARWRSAMSEGAIAVEDRLELARLEWADHKRRLALLALLLVIFGVLGVVSLLLLSAAVLVQFWDTPQRAMVAWLLAALWCVACGAVLALLLSMARQAHSAFALTRRELAHDWRAVKEQL
ncbi:MAG: phage holin family protein [Proteobacteria bacterium]|nr:phage holin family protein [Pseudomonadota bacterium]